MAQKKISISKSAKCPCGSGLKYSACCGPFIKQSKHALIAEALMRSRYTSYVIKNEEYLLSTWHHSTRPESLNLDGDVAQWLRLSILNTDAGTENDMEGMVEFNAEFKVNEQKQSLHEISRFIKEDDHWYYVDGDESE